MNYSPDILLTPTAIGIFAGLLVARLIALYGYRKRFSPTYLIGNSVILTAEVALLYAWLSGLGLFEMPLVFFTSLLVIVMLVLPLHITLYRKLERPFQCGLSNALLFAAAVCLLMGWEAI